MNGDHLTDLSSVDNADNANDADNAHSRESGIAKFPVDALPGACKTLVMEASESIGCPPDFIGLPMLVTLGAAIGNARVLQLKEGWTEGASIFGAVVAETGEKKTPAMNVALEPMKKHQARVRESYRKLLDEHQRELRQHKVDERESHKAGEPAPPPPREPVMERVLVEDTTVEALTVVLEGNSRGVLVSRDELSAWVRSMDQYKSGGKGSDRQFWLSSWSGSYVSVDRKGRAEPLILTRPFVSLFGSIQPSVIGELGDGRDDGLLDRFLLSYPEPVRSRWSDSEISGEDREAYRRLYEGLCSLHQPIDGQGDAEPEPLYFVPGAKDVFVDAVDGLKEEMESPGFPRSLRGPWSKLEAYLARLSLVLAMARVVEEGAPERVEVRDVLAAVDLLDYFKSHARKVHTGHRNKDSEDDALAADVAVFLRDRAGYFKDEPTVLHNELRSQHKPPRPEDLTRALNRIANQSPGLQVTTGGNMKKAGSNRRCVELSLTESALSASSALSALSVSPDSNGSRTTRGPKKVI